MLTARIALGLTLVLLLQSGPLWALGHDKVAAANSPLRNASGLEIDRIVLQGVQLFTSEKIEKVLQISPGDRLERSKVVQTEENIQALYRLHGYQEVRIQSRLVRKKNNAAVLETILEFVVQEGLPVRISKIDLVSDVPIEDSSQRSWEASREKIRTKLGLSFGDLLDQEKISDGRKFIHEFLASESYVGAKVTEVAETPASPPRVSNKKLAEVPATRWVDLEFHVDLGDRVSFGFQGNSVFTYAFLMNLVEEQRLLGLGKDYVGAIRTRLEDEYRASGYPLVTITPFTFEHKSRAGRKVTYYIKEGPRVSIESVGFDGNALFSSADLREQFFSKASGLVQHKIYVEKDVQKAAEILVDGLKERGYLSARLVTINSTYVSSSKSNSSSKAMKLIIYLYEGDQTQIQSVSIVGATVLTDLEIKNMLRLQEGAALNLFGLTDGIDQLKKTYLEKGYLSFRILNEGTDDLVKYSQENRLVDIVLKLEEGSQYRISHIDIEGLDRTKEFVVRRELSFKEGDILSGLSLGVTERKLRRLGIFSNVALRVVDDPDGDSLKVVKVSVQEADRGVISGGPGYRNDLGVRAFGQLAYTNLWGEDHTASINLAINRRFYRYNFLEGQVQFAYAWPWFLAPEVYFRPLISFGATQYINFAARTLTIAANWQKQFMVHPNLVGDFSYTFESINQFQSVRVGDDQQMTIGSVTPKLTLDMRDSALLPTSGLFATTSFDYAMPFMGSRSDIGYYRFQFRTDFYFPLTRGISFYLSFRTGYEKTLEPLPSANSLALNPNTDSIPLIKQFALGGIGSIRGYQLQELNFQGRFTSQSLAYVNYRSELDLPFAGSLKLALFVDAGNLLIDNYSFGMLRYGVGFGFHYLTPVGPVSLDYGLKVAPDPGTDASVVHFSVGII